MEGTSWVRKVDLATGAVQASSMTSTSSISAKAWSSWGDKIVSLTWKNQKGFIYDRATLAPKGEFTYAGEGLGADDRRHARYS
jgi:glutamine cyclotransferase